MDTKVQNVSLRSHSSMSFNSRSRSTLSPEAAFLFMPHRLTDKAKLGLHIDDSLKVCSFRKYTVVLLSNLCADDRWIQIISVIAGGPCDGILKVGDEILCVGDENFEGATVQEVSNMLATIQEDAVTFIIKKGQAPE